ncbi:uncharacterized protein LOC131688018 [Topomyia yanbarensis]|uniref:uncharacterized protein LOC131688018 n=1 Tax=Topomyia yanbarensis TaxID=2498891 RepID=UPI00273B60CA|nr:uncharacterized protein LOC131688018 [Topomyia yanbarensis]
MGRKCEFYTCGNHEGNKSGDGKSFFRFPRNEALCSLWVKACNSQKATQAFETDGVQAFRKKKMCSDHFSPGSFKDVARKSKGLVSGTVPITCEGFTGSNKDKKHNGTKSPEPSVEFLADESDFKLCEIAADVGPFCQEPISECPKLLEASPARRFYTIPDDGPIELLEHDDGQSLLVSELVFSSEQCPKTISDDEQQNNEQLSTELQRCHHRSTNNEENQNSFGPVDECNRLHQDIGLRNRIKVEKNINRKLKLKLMSVRRQLFVSTQTSNRRLETAKRRKGVVVALRKEMKALKKQKSATEKLGELAAANPIIKDSLINASRRPMARRYHPATIKFAAGIYLSGPRTYRYICNTKQIILPHKSTVYDYNKNIRLEPGINKTILSRIKDKTKWLRTKREKIVMVCVDGMSVKPELTYCAKSDTFYGFPDHGITRKIEKNDPTKLATEAVVVMVSGLYRKFKQPIGYLLAHNSLGSEIQMKLVVKSVIAIRAAGLDSPGDGPVYNQPKNVS